ncbi:hypothetical protein [Corynebacterium xerosis]
MAARGKPDARRAACPGWVPLIAYVVVLVLATRAIKAGERAGPS